MRPALALAVALALVLFLVVPSASAATLTIHAGGDPDGSLFFIPRSVTVTKGEDVRLTLVNDETTQAHDWVVLSYGERDLEAYAGPGETKTIAFNADVAGSFRIICQLVGHKQRGMEGTFTVKSKGIPDVAPATAGLVVVALALALSRRDRSKAA